MGDFYRINLTGVKHIFGYNTCSVLKKNDLGRYTTHPDPSVAPATLGMALARR